MQTYDFLAGIAPGVLSSGYPLERPLAPSALFKYLRSIPPSDNMGGNSASRHPRKGQAEQTDSADSESSALSPSD